jgi:hypothetical protein
MILKLVSFDSRHFQNVAQGIETVAPRKFRELFRKRSYISGCAVGRSLAVIAVAVVLVSHLFKSRHKAIFNPGVRRIPA